MVLFFGLLFNKNNLFRFNSNILPEQLFENSSSTNCYFLLSRSLYVNV